MGNECSHDCNYTLPQQDQFHVGQAGIKLQESQKQIKIVSDKTSKVSTLQLTQNRAEAQFPTLPSHIQSRIDKLSKYQKYLSSLTPQEQKLNSRKIYRCKSPFNFFYMNLEDRPEPYPIGKCIIYKLKERDEFAGYFQGTLTETFTISPQDSIIVFSNGCYFEGISQNQGRYFNENTGLKYEGGWGKEMPQKFGKEKNNKGSYEGQYQNGQKHGQGKFAWNSGSVYEGEFLKGLFNGKGQLIDQNQKYFYEGEFKNGEKHGNGAQKATVEKYVGEFRSGFRCGYGKLELFKDEKYQQVSKVYEGQFDQNQPNGKGELIMYEHGEAKDIIKAIWTKGKITAILSIV